MTSGELFSMDYEATVAYSNQYIQAAGDHRSAADNLSQAWHDWASQLGDLYAEARDYFVKGGALNQAMVGAHYRLADWHEQHGNSGLQSVGIVQQADEDGAAGLGGVVGDAAPPPATMA
jgi:hypothetical protein